MWLFYLCQYHHTLAFSGEGEGKWYLSAHVASALCDHDETIKSSFILILANKYDIELFDNKKGFQPELWGTLKIL